MGCRAWLTSRKSDYEDCPSGWIGADGLGQGGAAQS